MKTFPMFLTMTDRRVVILGGGEQATQKCRLMLKTEAEIEVFAPALDVELQALADNGRITHRTGPITAEALRGAPLVFVGTGCPGIDAALHAVARDAGALVNVVDQPDLCDAITPAIVDRDPVVVAIGTEGTAPVLARQVKTALERMLDPRLGDLAALAGRLRDYAAQRLGPRQRRDLWRWVFNGPLRAQHAREGDAAVARAIKDVIRTGSVPAAAPAPVALVGAGPGSSDLITLRGVQRLQEADIIFYDRLVDPGVLELARRDAERVFVGKEPGCHAWPQDKINAVIVAAAKRGQRVVRLKCGDPGVFARGAEEAEALQAANLEYEIVPGVTAASGAAAAVGGFLTERGKSDTLVLTTGRCADGNGVPDWVTHLTQRSNVAVYMGVAAAPSISDSLARAGLLDQIDLTAVSKAQHADQKVMRCRAADMVEELDRAGIESPAILFLSHRDVSTSGTAEPVPHLVAV
ncbi:siroheme synthase CysG [Tateyamaria sp. ANG-S1]|uniref:siroheme synthase CysG n=1 Tax=Tateyamaria sp. ANG-S1 TaxID=1577905 RepID=UPI00057FA85F|nr:siroheme synthase CysG [Tateyamaria sp. ANG-S1]KIC47989.1 siroheme synthase [Tateyamaria sp. ANG-S1]